MENIGGVESTLEFSSGNPPGCTEPPAGPASCTSWRAAGQHFGIAKTASVPTVISYHDFCNPSCVRTFDISTTGTLPLTTTTNLDFPDINDQSVFGGSGSPAPVFIYSALGSLSSAITSFPNSQTLIRVGSTSQRLADTAEIAFIRAGSVISTSGGTIDSGLSADVNNGGQVVYEKVISNFSQVFLASPVTTLCGDSRDQLNAEYAPGGVFPGGVIDSTTGSLTTGSLFVPLCSYETQGVNSQYFKFKQTCNGQPCGLNTGQYAWAPIRRPLVIQANSGYGLDQFKEQCDVQVPPATYGPRQITSAYRNPKKNARVSSGSAKRTSRHMFGDAVDFNNNSCAAGSPCKTTTNCGSTMATDEYDGMRMAAMVALAAYIEPISVSFCGHVHADWRGPSKGGIPPCSYPWCAVNSKADYVP